MKEIFTRNTGLYHILPCYTHLSPLLAGLRVAEVGCGTGEGAAWLSGGVCSSVLGLESDEGNLRKARELSGSTALNCTFTRLDLTTSGSLEQTLSSFKPDAIIALNPNPQILNPENIERLSACCGEHGMLVLQVPNPYRHRLPIGECTVFRDFKVSVFQVLQELQTRFSNIRIVGQRPLLGFMFSDEHQWELAAQHNVTLNTDLLRGQLQEPFGFLLLCSRLPLELVAEQDQVVGLSFDEFAQSLAMLCRQSAEQSVASSMAAQEPQSTVPQNNTTPWCSSGAAARTMAPQGGAICLDKDEYFAQTPAKAEQVLDHTITSGGRLVDQTETISRAETRTDSGIKTSPETTSTNSDHPDAAAPGPSPWSPECQIHLLEQETNRLRTEVAIRDSLLLLWESTTSTQKRAAREENPTHVPEDVSTERIRLKLENRALHSALFNTANSLREHQQTLRETVVTLRERSSDLAIYKQKLNAQQTTIEETQARLQEALARNEQLELAIQELEAERDRHISSSEHKDSQEQETPLCVVDLPQASTSTGDNTTTVAIPLVLQQFDELRQAATTSMARIKALEEWLVQAAGNLEKTREKLVSSPARATTRTKKASAADSPGTTAQGEPEPSPSPRRTNRRPAATTKEKTE